MKTRVGLRRHVLELLALSAVSVSGPALASDLWAPTPSAMAPAARSGQTVLVDSVRNRVIMSGGLSSGGALASAAVMDLATHAWQDSAATSAPPSARYDHSAIWNQPAGRYVVFGGTNGTTRFADTWSLDPTPMTWTALSTSGSAPSARSNHVAVFDAAGNRLIVFGGFNGTSVLNDLYSLDLGTLQWTALSPSGTLPEARQGALAVYDPVHRALVLFGGAGSTTPYLADAWSLDLATLAWAPIVTPESGASAPAGRVDCAGDLDPVRLQLLVVGGRTGAGTYASDAWTLSLHNHHWTQVSNTAAIARANAGGVVTRLDDRFLLINGESGAGILSDAWLFDLAAHTWSLWPAPGTVPSNRLDYFFTSDDANQRILLFGGWLGTNKSTAMNDLYQLTYPSASSQGMQWTQLTQTNPPAPRYGIGSVIDPPRNRVLLFGGANQVNFTSNDLWAMDLTTRVWTQLTPVGGPPPARNNYAIVYDAPRVRMIIHGGSQTGSTSYSDTWVYDCAANTWTQVATGLPRPAARAGQWYADDASRNRMLVGSGSNGSTFYNDTWALDYTSLTWAQVATSGTFSPGWQSVAGVKDLAHDRVIIFGGFQNGIYSNQTWQLDLLTNVWTQLSPLGLTPEARASHQMTFNPQRNWAVMWAGNNGPKVLGSGGVFYTFDTPPPTGIAAGPPPVANARLQVQRLAAGTVRFVLPADWRGAGQLQVLRADGRLVASLAASATGRPVVWSAVDAAGRALPRGVYLVRAQSAVSLATAKLVLF